MSSGEELRLIADLLQPVKDELQKIEAGMNELKAKLRYVEQSLVNGTDKNVLLLAERCDELAGRINQVFWETSKNLIYEMKINALIEKVSILEKNVEELKNKIA